MSSKVIKFRTFFFNNNSARWLIVEKVLFISKNNRGIRVYSPQVQTLIAEKLQKAVSNIRVNRGKLRVIYQKFKG